MSTGGPEASSVSAHFVSAEPYDPDAPERLSDAEAEYYAASRWRLMWWRLRRHRLAVGAVAVLAMFYAVVALCEFLAPYALYSRHSDSIFAPPQSVRFVHRGKLHRPFVYPMRQTLDRETFRRVYHEDRTRTLPLRFWCRGDRYRFWGGFESDLHLVCPPHGGSLYFLGTDRLGRDIWSRMLYGARVSLTIGLIGVVISFSLGVVLGSAAGYFGGWTDSVVQRLIEILRSFPELPLWMALSAALPVTWSPIGVFVAITVILGLIDWTGLARAVRARILALREEDFCTAAVLLGARPSRIIGRHLLPSLYSHLIASATVSIPAMILGETALSFLGLGLRPPITSWGVLLAEAQNINAVALYPWLLFPMVPVILTVLSFNFLGDGLRDAADPYRAV